MTGLEDVVRERGQGVRGAEGALRQDRRGHHPLGGGAEHSQSRRQEVPLAIALYQRHIAVVLIETHPSFHFQGRVRKLHSVHGCGEYPEAVPRQAGQRGRGQAQGQGEEGQERKEGEEIRDPCGRQLSCAPYVIKSNWASGFGIVYSLSDFPIVKSTYACHVKV